MRILKSFNHKNPSSDKVSGACSAILGGCCNNDNNFAYAGFFGAGLNNPAHMAPHTFHVECLNAINTPSWPGGASTFPPGTLFYFAAGAVANVHTCPLYIWV